jgi:hypothetical protein
MQAQAQREYVPSHDGREPERVAQSSFLGELTEELFQRAGLEPGMRVLAVGCATGLPPPRMILAAHVRRGPDSGICARLADVTRSLIPAMEPCGRPTAREIGADTLHARLLAEETALGATIVAPSLVAPGSADLDVCLIVQPIPVPPCPCENF